MNSNKLAYSSLASLSRRSLLCCVVAFSSWSNAKSVGLPDLQCVIAPSLTVDIASPVPGVLSSVAVDRSQLVKSGQVVAELDSGVERAELALASARADIMSEIRLNEVNLDYDKRRRDRMHSLEEAKAASTQDRERAARNADLSKWRVRQAKDINQLRSLELARSEAVLKRKSITSPIDGVVVTRYRSAGEYVKEQPIVRVVQLDPLHVEAAVPMEYFGEIKNGMKANVRLHNNASVAYASSVAAVDPIGDAQSNTFGVRLELPNSDLRIPAGSKCNLSFALR